MLQLVCITCAILCYHLLAWQAGVFQNSPDFKPDAVEGRNPGVPMSCLLLWCLINLGRPFLIAEEDMAGSTKTYVGTHAPESAWNNYGQDATNISYELEETSWRLYWQSWRSSCQTVASAIQPESSTSGDAGTDTRQQSRQVFRALPALSRSIPEQGTVIWL